MGWISALASLAGAAASGIGSAVVNRKMEDEAAKQHGEANQMIYKQLYQDPTKRADYAAMMGQIQRQLKGQQDVLAARNKIVGGTNEAEAAQRAAQAEVIGDANEQAMAQQAKRSDMLQNQLMEEKRRNDATRTAFLDARMQNWTNLAANSAGMFGGFEKDADGGVRVKPASGTGGNGGYRPVSQAALTNMEANANSFTYPKIASAATALSEKMRLNGRGNWKSEGAYL